MLTLAGSLYKKHPKIPVYGMTIINRLFFGILHARLGKPIKNYSDFDEAIEDIRQRCSTNREKNFITNLYEVSQEGDLKLIEIDFIELSGLMKRAQEYHPTAF